METENPTDPENSKWVVAYIMVFRPALSLQRLAQTFHVFGDLSKNPPHGVTWGVLLHRAYKNISRSPRVLLFSITAFPQNTKTSTRWVYGEFHCSNSNSLATCPLALFLLHYALPPKTRRCMDHETSSVQTTTALATCCSPRLLRVIRVFTFYFGKTQNSKS